MKHKILIILTALAIFTSATGNTIYSSDYNELLTIVPVYVYDISDTSGTLIFIGNIDIPTAPSGSALILITNIRKLSTGTQITRTARNASGVAYPSATSVSINGSAYSIP